MSENLQDCLERYAEDRDAKHIESAYGLLISASKSWKPGRNFVYTSQEILQLAVLSAEANLSEIVSSVINIYESTFGSNSEFRDLISLLFAEICFQEGDFSMGRISLAMSHIERSVYEAIESDHDYIVKNLLILLYKFVRTKLNSSKKSDLVSFLKQKLKMLWILITNNISGSYVLECFLLKLTCKSVQKRSQSASGDSG
ncbi:unnamed protein product [Heterobilharzia americana]|nr:unnamed protein product [Heterobilharzia americana]